jgi:hypothetical protein
VREQLTQSDVLALSWSSLATYRKSLPLDQLACTAIVPLLGMRRCLVGGGPWPRPLLWPGTGSRFASQPAGRACPLPSAPDRAGVG